MKLKPLTLSDVEQVRQWRNESLSSLRTPFLLTTEQQEQFYRNVICDRQANARYWGIHDAVHNFIGMVGLENISWENRNAEISIILNPEVQGNGHGSQAVELLLNQGFDYLNLENIFGECYLSNPAVKFWEKNIEKYSGTKTILPNRKYWEGEYWDSLYFNFNKSDYKGR